MCVYECAFKVIITMLAHEYCFNGLYLYQFVLLRLKKLNDSKLFILQMHFYTFII